MFGYSNRLVPIRRLCSPFVLFLKIINVMLAFFLNGGAFIYIILNLTVLLLVCKLFQWRCVAIGLTGFCLTLPGAVCSARAIGWLTAIAQRANQSAAAEEPSAIRGTAQESFNREQREGAERSRQPFSLNRTQWPIWVSFVPKGSYI